MKKIGILTGGGDCPGLNAVIRAVTVRAEAHRIEVMGIRGGWRGFLENDTQKLTAKNTRGIVHEGGTVLGTSRVNPFQIKGGPERVDAAFAAWHLDGLVVTGGDGTLSLARMMSERGHHIVGVPKTIDNDIGGTEVTFGFDTAVQVATDAIDRLRTTAESHERVMVVEVMGRHAGWIALAAGLAGGADAIAIPERPTTIESLSQVIHLRRAQGKLFSLVVVAEGATIGEGDAPPELVVANKNLDDFGRPRLGGVGHHVARRLEEHTGVPCRVTVLGHIQRGGTPTARDRLLALRFGEAALEYLVAGKSGVMAALKADEIVPILLSEATKEPRLVDDKWQAFAEKFTT